MQHYSILKIGLSRENDKLNLYTSLQESKTVRK